MNVLSLFDGKGCGLLALKRAGVHVDNYYASEIDKYCITIAKKNHPEIVHLGDILNHEHWNLPKIDLIIGGSPCQSISLLGDGSGLLGKSKLFYSYFEVLKKFNSEYFLFENVKGKRDSLAEISRILQTQPVEINSSIMSAQLRRRLYWTNIPLLPLPKCRGVILTDILEEGVPRDSILSEGRLKWFHSENNQKRLGKFSYLDPIKAYCLLARSDANWNSTYVTRGQMVTRLTPIEWERLQTLPDNYTEGVSNFQRYKMIGNGWTIDVLAHLFMGLK